MCRHLAYVGPPVRLGALLADPPFSLVRQAWAPRRQTQGVVNADGFGLGWYVGGGQPPARHRGTGPVWSDETFAELARVIHAPAFLATVRSATDGMPFGVAATAPLRHGRWLFSHNGALAGGLAAGAALLGGLPPERLLALEARVDSALLWALLVHHLDAGRPPATALAAVLRRAVEVGGGRLNLLLTDGEGIWATRWGASLSWRMISGGAVVASEPYDDQPGWQDVPEGHVVEAGSWGVRTAPLTEVLVAEGSSADDDQVRVP